MTTKYTGAIIFTKFTNLTPYFESKFGSMHDTHATSLGYNQLKHSYSRERDVQLILLYRYERGADNAVHTICKVKCPINPLPIKGEFEVVSLSEMIAFLKRNGWEFKRQLPTSLLK